MLLPGSNLPSVEVPSIDKAVHFVSYAVFTLLLLKGFYINHEIKNYFLLSAVISIGYGLVLELLQAVVPHRGVDMIDILANILGALAAMAIFPYIGK